MNKGELVDAIATDANISKTDAESALNAFINSVQSAITAGENVPKPGSVTFSPDVIADCTELMNAFSALSASVLLRFASAAIASTSSPLFTETSTHRVCVRVMRTYSPRYVKHFSRNARGIHHSLRDFCQDRRMRGDAHADCSMIAQVDARRRL